MDRLAVARAALMQAEESVGLAAARGIPQGHEEVWADAAGTWDIPPSLDGVFPHGLARGMTIGVSGSRLATLLVAGMVSAQGAWVACLGVPDMGWGAACILGMNIEHTVHVPGRQNPITSRVISTAIEGFDAVMVGHDVRLDARERRLLTRKALSHGTLLIAEGWHVRERVTGAFLGVDGVQRGRGHISDIRMELACPGNRPLQIKIHSTGWSVCEGLRSLPTDNLRQQADVPAPVSSQPLLQVVRA